VNDYLLVANKEKETSEENEMIIKEEEMKILKTYRTDTAPREPKSALRSLMQRVGLTIGPNVDIPAMTEFEEFAFLGIDGKLQ